MDALTEREGWHTVIWKHAISIVDLMAFERDTASDRLGLRLSASGPDWLEGTISLDERTQARPGTFHFGTLAILAESLGSVAANLCVDQSRQFCVGQSIQVQHPEPLSCDELRARATPIDINEQRQVWQIDIMCAGGKTVAVATLTMAVKDRS